MCCLLSAVCSVHSQAGSSQLLPPVTTVVAPLTVELQHCFTTVGCWLTTALTRDMFCRGLAPPRPSTADRSGHAVGTALQLPSSCPPLMPVFCHVMFSQKWAAGNSALDTWTLALPICCEQTPPLHWMTSCSMCKASVRVPDTHRQQLSYD